MHHVDATVLLLLLTACGGTADEGKAPPASPASTGNGMAGMAPAAQETPAFDQMFIDMMVPHHQGAVEMAKIARERAEHAEIKAAADGIIASQEAEIGKMKAWRKAWVGSEDTPAMDMPMTEMKMPGMSGMANMAKDIEALKTATPLDLAFIDTMIPHHEQAVEMAQRAAESAQNVEIKDLAADTISDQQKEIAQMQEWRMAQGVVPDGTTGGWAPLVVPTKKHRSIFSFPSALPPSPVSSR